GYNRHFTFSVKKIRSTVSQGGFS
ncbi:hypothetical protein MIMGU_mgv1a0071742mg, partial [Erythranthe guttata]